VSEWLARDEIRLGATIPWVGFGDPGHFYSHEIRATDRFQYKLNRGKSMCSQDISG